MRDAEKLRLSQSLHFLSNGVDGFSTPPPAHMGIPPYHHLDPAKVHGKITRFYLPKYFSRIHTYF